MTCIHSKQIAIIFALFSVLFFSGTVYCVDWADVRYQPNHPAAGDGTTDDTQAFQEAIDSLGPAGGTVYVKGVYLINSNLNLSDNVFLVGDELSPGRNTSRDYRPANFASYLIVGQNATITLNSHSGVKNLIIVSGAIFDDLTTPPYGTYGTEIVPKYDGTLFTPNRSVAVADPVIENLLVLGFKYLYDGTDGHGSDGSVIPRAAPLGRPIFRNIRGDCTNGIFVTSVGDVGRAENCHMWPFVTNGLGGNSGLRDGTAFYTGHGSTWMKWDDCFAFGYNIGHLVDGVQSVRQINCGADGPSSNGTQNIIGFKYQGQIINAKNLNPTVAAQGTSGILINTTPFNNIADVGIIGGTFKGDSANGHIDIQSGTYTFIGCTFWGNSAVGHIRLGSGAGPGVVTGCTFGNNGSSQPIFGDATAISKCNLTDSTYTGGSYTKQQMLTWTPAITFGGNSTGITYAASYGTYTVKDNIVTVTFQITLASKGTSTGNARITGFPVPSNTGYFGGAISPFATRLSGLSGTVLASINGNSSNIDLFQSAPTGLTPLTDSHFTDTTVLAGMLQYLSQ